MLKKYLKIYFQDKRILSFLIIILGSLAWSLVMFKSGLKYSFGLGFWGANGHDGIWHIAVIESLLRGSFDMPIFSGQPIQNYHLGFDLVVAILHKITFIPVINLYFQVIPILLSLGTGISVYSLILIWKKSHLAAFCSTFFVYFGGSFGWILTYFRSGKLGGESTFWSQQSISTLVNPPFALSILMIFLGLNFLIKGINTKNKKYLTLSTFLFGTLISIKVYAGILVLLALFVAGMYQMILVRKGISIMKVFAGALILSLILILPIIDFGKTTLVWSPFWFLETMMHLTDRVGWVKFGEAMVNYKLAGYWSKATLFYGISLVIFLIGNFGTRIIGVVYIFKTLRKKAIDYVDVFFGVMLTVGIILPLLFVQSGTPWNTIQFFYYSQVILAIMCGVVLGEILAAKRIQGLLFILVVFVFTIPTTISTLADVYIPRRPPAALSYNELSALTFLSNQEKGVVLTFPFDLQEANAAIANPPRPLYLYESTAYVSAFSKKDVYLEDEVNLNITGYDWPQRLDKVNLFLNTLDQNEARKFLNENDISYIYWVKEQRARLGETQLGIEKIFENESVNIFKVESN